jgi:uncharacterized protein YjiS (DUF1127 family)
LRDIDTLQLTADHICINTKREAAMPQHDILSSPRLFDLAGHITRFKVGVITLTARRKERAALARLDAHLLRDIGIDLQSATFESTKPAWRD